jgi:HPr kinase/phosphorylase
MSEASMDGRLNVHATGVALDGVGIILRGPSGAGKSLLALELLDRWEHHGWNALLVADDRLELKVEPAGLTMHAPPAIGGLIELRGRGIVRRPHTSAAPVHLVVDLVDSLVRMVEENELTTNLFGITLPRCPVPQRSVVDSAHQMLLIGEAMVSLRRTGPGHR